MSDGELNSESPILGDGPDIVGPIRFAGTIALLVLAFVALLPLHALGLVFRGLRGRAAMLWHRFALRLLSVRRLVTGAIGTERPLLLLANHVSWLDILVLGSLAPLSFVAKREVASWPVIGLLARMQRTIYVDRAKPHHTGHVADQVAKRLGEGGVVLLFAEGTSSDGNRVLPFRSSLIGAAGRAAAGGGEVHVQPVALAYVRQHGLPLGRQHRADVAWYGSMGLAPHLRKIAGSGAIDVRVVFGAIAPLGAAAERKNVAREAGAAVRRVVAGLNSGASPEAMIAAERAHLP